MLRTAIFACLALLFASSVSAASSDPTRQEHTTAQLHSNHDVVAAGQPFTVLFHLAIDDHWHTYWKNTGDSGIPTGITWHLPEGWRASPIVWQPPKRLPYGPLMNYGYDENAYHLVDITAPPGASGEVTLIGTANWLVCQEECIPESAEISLPITLGDPVRSDRFQQIETLAASAASPVVKATFALRDGFVVLQVPAAEFGGLRPDKAYFFTDEPATVEPAAPQKELIHTDGSLQLSMTAGSFPIKNRLGGVLEVQDSGGSIRHFTVEATAGKITAPASQPLADAPTGAPLLITLFFALLGGIILNAMPCVFPVLSLKALGLSRKSSADKSHVAAHGFAYTGGVVVSFAAVGLVLILLKLTGSAIGWGYQMQSPLFVASLTYLLFLIGLNLAGYFDIMFHMSVSTTQESKETLKGSFAMGALVTLVATPCSAPFMATALGAALSQPPAIGMAIFITMGIGLALPYLLLTTIPGALRWMPRPGAWMERFKQFLAFPMFASAIWLAWVFTLQTGATAGAMLLLGLLFTVFSIWLWRVLSPGTATAKAAIAVLLICLAVSPLYFLPQNSQNQVMSEHTVYSEEALATLLAAKKPVFVYATAAWCITCKVNERTSLDDNRVKGYFAAEGITVMVADWTSENPVITRFLETFGRAGVPLYVFYPTEGEPRILPQLLTPDTIIDSTQQ